MTYADYALNAEPPKHGAPWTTAQASARAPASSAAEVQKRTRRSPPPDLRSAVCSSTPRTDCSSPPTCPPCFLPGVQPHLSPLLPPRVQGHLRPHQHPCASRVH